MGQPELALIAARAELRDSETYGVPAALDKIAHKFYYGSLRASESSGREQMLARREGNINEPTYHEVEAKSALNRTRGMPLAWSLNPYRGCRHACHYCFARASHAYFDLHPGKDFARHIFVKTNMAEVLRRELSRRSWRREDVSVGTATDPYQPAEGRYKVTRSCLTALAEARTPASITTKGSLIVRDIDLLRAVRDRAGSCSVSMSLTSLDAALLRRLEPGVASPRQRLNAIRRLADHGIRVGLALAPILPGITDSPASLADLVRAAADHGAAFVWTGTVHLEPVVRDWLFEALTPTFPEAMVSYRRWFGAPGKQARARYSPRSIDRRITQLVSAVGADCGLPLPQPGLRLAAIAQASEQLPLNI
ncbi:MAG: radical SAM protein [Dehalococcoidia bacterium]|nr:radical SAM protein [Dehalococcoidia bacterium]